MAGSPQKSPTRAARTLRDFEQSLPMELLRAREAAMARFRPMLREHGLTEQQWRVVRALADYPDSDASELARLSFLLSPSLTRILQFLETEKLVRRRADANDLRRSVFRLTGKGQRVFDQVAPDAAREYADIEQAFGAKRLEQLYRLLAEFSAALPAEPRSST